MGVVVRQGLLLLSAPLLMKAGSGTSARGGMQTIQGWLDELEMLACLLRGVAKQPGGKLSWAWAKGSLGCKRKMRQG